MRNQLDKNRRNFQTDEQSHNETRCQRYDFRRIGTGDIEQRLAEIAQHSGLAVAPEALKIIASHADGGLRDALSILDQCTTMEDGELPVY